MTFGRMCDFGLVGMRMLVVLVGRVMDETLTLTTDYSGDATSLLLRTLLLLFF